ncbi:M48 family metallopeptidase [Desertivirga brevis]|uniref:M48 family metallopeptidase n=1 Tax=Desertivirga brevis TaxID=2810310 RepID=UPI001A972B4A|nr:M48 family metallopeptidase [Pedobacter sp. SYSU D00873]
MQYLFPPKPSDIREGITNVSPAFKKEVVKVFLLCVLFLLWYLVLLAGTVGIAFLFGFLGILLVSEVQHFATLMIAIGAVVMGVMLIVFMLKALILKKTDPVPTVGEVTPETEPVFYEFIKRVCDETRAPFPKKIYLVEDVNAFVSYDSTFLSLLFPARKNLYVGLGLINSSTISELKAVIAHEFGHFSQGSMRFGSYVYHFNQIIYKIVADNSGYNATIEKWASFSNYFALFANINMGIIRGIQWLMVKCYEILNKGYRSLARQMEFHADSVAASVAGSAPLITSLYRIDLAVESYQHLLNYYNQSIKDNFRADNLYTHHFKLMQLLAQKENVQLKNGFAMVDAETINKLGRSRVVVKYQWASHPSTADREAALLKLSIPSETIDESAWKLFADPASIQVANTERIYQSVSFSSEPALLAVEEFELKYQEYLSSTNYQPEYKGYYNNRNVATFETSLDSYIPEDLSIEDLFSEEHLSLPKTIAQIEGDITVLDSISAVGTGFKSFDFEGLRYPIGDAYSITNHLKNELQEVQKKVNKHDQEIYYIARRNALGQGKAEELEHAFGSMFRQSELTEADVRLYNEMAEVVAPVYSTLPIEEIKAQVMIIIRKEKELKKRMTEILEDPKIGEVDSFKDHLTSIKELCESTHLYFNEGRYLNEQLDLLNTAANAFLNVSSEYYFMVKKEALEVQLRMLYPSRISVGS